MENVKPDRLKLTWANEDDIRIIFDSNSLRKAIRSCDLKKIALMLESNANELHNFFTQTDSNKDGKLVEHAWLKHLAVKIHLLTKNLSSDVTNEHGKNQYDSELFKKILHKLLTFIDRETLTKDFIERHNFTEIVKSDIEEVMKEFDTNITKETDSLSPNSSESSNEHTQENLDADSNAHTRSSIDTKTQESEVGRTTLNEQEDQSYSPSKTYFTIKNQETSYGDGEIKSIDDSEELSVITNEYIAWLYSLPEEIKGYLSKSSAIQEIIAHFEEEQNFFTVKSVVGLVMHLFASSLEDLHQVIWGNNDEYIQSSEIDLNRKNSTSVKSEFYMPPDFDIADIPDAKTILPLIPEEFSNLDPVFTGVNFNMDIAY